MRWQDIGVASQMSWLVTALAALLVGCSPAVAHTPARPTAAATASASASASATPPPTAPSPTQSPQPTQPPAPKPPSPSALPVAPGAGRLRQTHAFPSTKTTAFRDAMADLWLAVTTGKPRFALPAFFPEAAYKQVKAIASPESDWRNRLWYDFTLDVAAVHALLGKNAKNARLITVIVPAGYAAWVSPGGCYNNVGYWHVPGARVVYRQDGQLRSFGIASLISWRGDWYVVHFGAVLRGGGYGEVDDPAAGTGSPGPPGGC